MHPPALLHYKEKSTDSHTLAKKWRPFSAAFHVSIHSVGRMNCFWCHLHRFHKESLCGSGPWLHVLMSSVVSRSFLMHQPQACTRLLTCFSQVFLLTSVSRKRRSALFFLMFFRRRDTATLRTMITTMKRLPITPAAIRGVLGRVSEP